MSAAFRIRLNGVATQPTDRVGNVDEGHNRHAVWSAGLLVVGKRF